MMIRPTIALAACLACCQGFLAPQRAARMDVGVAIRGIRDQYEAKAAERAKTSDILKEEAENAAARLKMEFEAYKRTSKYAGESLESFKERRDAVSAVPRRNGWIAFGVAVALNLKLFLFSPVEIKAVAADPNGICTSAAGDAKRPEKDKGLNSYGKPCMPLPDFAAGLLFGTP